MKADLVLVGGGLANSLIAWRLLAEDEGFDLLLIEQGETLGGEHVWSFHGSDLSSEQQSWIGPLVARSWPSQEVHFPRYRRTLRQGYHSMTSNRLDDCMRTHLGERLLLGARVAEVSATEVMLADGRRIRARAVIDGRGLRSSPSMAFAWQKFLGLHVDLEQPAGLETPILMDATVEQVDGYRFVYSLPFSQRRLLIEDTYYSDAPDLDKERIRSRVHRYAEERGWRIGNVIAEESGVLPITLAGDIDLFWTERPAGVPCSGMRAALFHPTTGYSLPEAVRLADEIAQMRSLDSAALDAMIRARSRRLWRRGAFFRLLNRMLFQAAEPKLRYRVFQRFYRLSEPLIERFYAGRPSLADRARILMGKPPVPIARALPCFFAGSARSAKARRSNERGKTI